MKPVLWYHPVSQRVRYDGAGLGSSWIPLYRKHEWVELTEEETQTLYDRYATYQEYDAWESGWFDFARAIEAKLKEKNEKT